MAFPLWLVVSLGLGATPRAQEQILGWPLVPLGTENVESYAALDQALESRVLIPLGESWSYFPGSEEPSPELEWTHADFDESGWSRGATPFTYGPSVLPELGTRVPEFGAGLSTLYLRCKFNMPDPSLYSGIWLEMWVDDGYILYFNKVEERRLNAGDSLKRRNFDATATADRLLLQRPMPRFDLTRPISAGIHQIAIQALIADQDRKSFGFYPTVRGIYNSTPESELAHYEELKGMLESEGESAAQRSIYLEGRYHQRIGAHGEALAAYAELALLDPEAVELWQRSLECHRALGTLADFELQLRDQLLAGSATGACMQTYYELWFEALGRPVVALSELLPGNLDLSACPELENALWAARTLAAEQVLRINLGAANEIERDGVRWSRGRFGAQGGDFVSESPLDSGIGSRRSLDGLDPMLHFPLPNGTYALSLWGCNETLGKPVELYLEGTRHRAQVLGSDLAKGKRYVVQVLDGFLDLDLISGAEKDDTRPATLGALELRRLSDEEALAEVRLAATSGAPSTQTTLAAVQLAQAEWALGNLAAALAAFERVEGTPAFNLEHQARLSALRDALLPAIRTQASARDLARRHAANWQSLHAKAEAAEGSEESAVDYFAGLCHQRAGELDQAIGYFEGLVFGECEEPGPYIGMALCLEAADLGEDAAGILDLALEHGLAPEGALLQAWISMQLGGLGRDPWELLDQLAEMDIAPRQVIVPTSEEYGRPWRFTYVEPTATTWSRPSFSIDHWTPGLAPIGSGFPAKGYPRTLWNRIMLFARTSFELDAPNLLYPFLRVYGRGSNDVYLNGSRVSRHLIATADYTRMPLRAPSVSGAATTALNTGLQRGENLLGMFGYNSSGPSQLDVGIEQDFELLFWIRERLREDGALRFNCGGEDWTSADGRRFYADRFYSWGITGSLSSEAESQDILGTEDDELYRTTRRFYDDGVSAWYEIPLPDGEYRVVLHFAEIEAKYREPGARNFSLTVEEVRLEEALDVAAEAGYQSALQKSFDVEVIDGWMDIKLTHKEFFSFVNGIEILAK